MSFFTRFFKFRIFKFRTTLTEELDDLHCESTNLQQNLNQIRLRQRIWTKWFAIYVILAYLVLNIFYYTFFLPQDNIIRTYAVLASVTLGILLYGIHWSIRWYFRTVIRTKEERLILFKGRKQELIEEVKNKETYAVARNLLEKYGETFSPEVRSPVANGNNKDVRPRASFKPGSDKPAVSVVSPKPSTFENGNQQIQTPVRGGPTRLAAGVTPGKLPRSILPPQRTFWGTILDTIVGDGPSKRYALICKSCNSHNGMALEEEFEYLSFRCAYCNYFNSARKQKPVFNPEVLSTTQTQNKPNVERTEMSVTDSSDSTDEPRLTRRSIRIPATNNNNINVRSRSISNENRRQLYPALSSSEESLSDKKK